MAKKEIKNVAASVKARLMNIAKESGKDFQSIILQYVQEKFLYRLSISKYADNFILKGALLFLAFDISRLRPTKDIDFLGIEISQDSETIKNIFKNILIIENNDGLVFDYQNIKFTEITERNKYRGLRIEFLTFLENTRINMQIDVGYGDKITAGPVSIEFPVLLDSQIPKLKAYSIESAFAEKFEAAVSINFLSSRMKDFYDIWFFASKYIFNSTDLYDAIFTTFDNRNTKIDDRDLVYSKKFMNDDGRQRMWEAFLKKNKLTSVQKFSELIEKLKLFIEPILNSSNNLKWNPEKWQWE